ncbi:MAG: hypothetical protein ACJ763_06035 [Bdellovibrionia bacterium]
MAIRTRSTSQSTSLNETPIKHTAGGEMPDPTEQHHVNPEELEALGGVEGEETTSNFLNKSKSYLPMALGAIGLGLGIYFVAKRYGQSALMGRVTGWFTNRFGAQMKEGEGNTLDAGSAGSEGQRALDIDDVPPSRLMGA